MGDIFGRVSTWVMAGFFIVGLGLILRNPAADATIGNTIFSGAKGLTQQLQQG